MKLPNIIIVEGIDRVGKTTLVNKIVEELNYSKFVPLNKISDRTEVIETEKTYATLSVLKLLKNDRIIIDRFHLSEFIYGFADRGYANKECENMDKILSELNALLIYVRPTDLKKSITEHGSDLQEHHIMFELIFKASRMRKVVCDYNSLDAIVESLKVGAHE